MKNKAGHSWRLCSLVVFITYGVNFKKMTAIVLTGPFIFKKEVLKYQLILMSSLSTDMCVYIYP